MNDQIEKLLDSIDVNPKIRELAEQSGCSIDRLGFGEGHLEKFAELIVRECTTLLFNESERLYEYSTECDNMRESDEAEVVAEKCVDLITMIEQHFGVLE